MSEAGFPATDSGRDDQEMAKLGKKQQTRVRSSQYSTSTRPITLKPYREISASGVSSDLLARYRLAGNPYLRTLRMSGARTAQAAD